MATSEERRRPRTARDRSNAVVAGVCSGLARRIGVDPIIVRIGFVIATIATRGGAVAAYVLLWVFMDEGDRDPKPGDVNRFEAAIGRIPMANWRIAAGVGFLTLSFLLVLREIGLWWSDAAIWPLILAASGAALLWRQSNKNVPPTSSASPPGVAGSVEGPATDAPDFDPPIGSRVADIYRGGFGIALVVGAALLFLYANGALGQARDVVLAVVVAATALGLILAPFLWRLGRNLASERSERIRSQERAEVAAHLHDSVLQTLALVQKRAGDPKEVAALARRQERELRTWLFDGATGRSGDSLAVALDQVAAEVEDAHGVAIDVVNVGDRPLDEQGRALVAATREALTNAAKFAGDSGPVAVYAEMSPERAQVFVRDRGDGFDATAIPAGRQGVRESIIARMHRHGGKATIRSGHGGGTEVELSVEGERS
jgi:signal transduction histidine kinase/phage shock protein PspC (stress-responsive transcriptional regulator)